VEVNNREIEILTAGIKEIKEIKGASDDLIP
jgi:hypothetical protein